MVDSTALICIEAILISKAINFAGFSISFVDARRIGGYIMIKKGHRDLWQYMMAIFPHAYIPSVIFF